MNTSNTSVSEIQNELEIILIPLGFEIYPFKIGWYNDCVRNAFQLPYNYDNLAFVIISTPSMFEKAFLPFICGKENKEAKDPIDDCVSHHFNKLKKALPHLNLNIFHDFDFTASRRPKILVQTAAHTAGATYYYQRSDVMKEPWDKHKKIFGVCIHPKYGGWFGLRGVIILEDILCPELKQRLPLDVLVTEEQKVDLLEKFNFCWQDCSYRDIIPVVEKYSENQVQYFSTKPQDRFALIEIYRKECYQINKSTE